MNNKEEACGKRAKKGALGVIGMSGDDIKKFIQTSGTGAAKVALSGKVKSRGEMCVILHSFRAGRELIAASGIRSNFRMTPSPNRSPNTSKPAPRRASPVKMTKEQERAYFTTMPKLVRTVSPNMRTNMERELNNFIKSEQNRKAMELYKEMEGLTKSKKEKSYVQYGVRILGKRPTGEQIQEAMKKKSVNKKKNNSSSSSNNNNVSSVRSERSERGSNASGSNSNRGGSNNGGSVNGNGINRSQYQNLTAKRNKIVKVKNTSSRFTKKKKGFVVSGPFCLLNPTTKSCRAAMKYPGFFRRKLGKGKGTQKIGTHTGTKTKKVVFMKLKEVNSIKTARIPTKSKPGAYFTHGTRSRPTKTQLRMANNERWRRYETLVKNMPSDNENKRSQLANKLMKEALVNVMAGKIENRPRRLVVKRERQMKPVQSELSKIFQKSYMTGIQLEPYYKSPPKKKETGPRKKKAVSSSNSNSGENFAIELARRLNKKAGSSSSGSSSRKSSSSSSAASN